MHPYFELLPSGMHYRQLRTTRDVNGCFNIEDLHQSSSAFPQKFVFAVPVNHKTQKGSKEAKHNWCTVDNYILFFSASLIAILKKMEGQFV